MKKITAFTLSEVLITIGIIGIIAAIILPAVKANIDKTVIKKQFKQAASVIQQALMKASLDYGNIPPSCYYWKENPWGPAKCGEYDANGNCSKWVLSNGNDLPAQYNGVYDDCMAFLPYFENTLRIAKKCETDGFKKGCRPDYPGIDEIAADTSGGGNNIDTNKKTNNYPNFRAAKLKDLPTFVLNNGIIIMLYDNGTVYGPSLMAVDVNGFKKPNIWGKDLFVFVVKGNKKAPLTVSGSSFTEVVSKGGVTSEAMFRE